VAERTGTAVPRVHGARPPPPEWPREALAYPLRRPALFAGATLFLFALDLLQQWNLFVGWVAKAVALPVYLRWQFHAASMSAAGHDAPPGFARVLDMDRAGLRSFLRFLLVALALSAPGAILLMVGRPLPGAILLVVGSAGLSAVALSRAVGDPSVGRPMGAAGWVLRRPLALLVGSIGWWAAGLLEWLAVALSELSFAAAASAMFASRVLVTWLWLVSARAIGVAGRAWTPTASGA
jgi:hypothetical protein